jgi:hypothetical protein
MKNNAKIQRLIDEIRQDMEDINLLRQTAYIDTGNFNFYNNYLLNRINTNIEKLIKEEQNND